MMFQIARRDDVLAGTSAKPCCSGSMHRSAPKGEAMGGLDRINRILAGRPITRPELLGGAIFVLVWFLMDLHQYIAWLLEPACR